MQQAGTLWVADLMQVISFHKDSGITNNTQYLPCMSVWGNSVMQSLYCIELQTTELSFGEPRGLGSEGILYYVAHYTTKCKS